jgi:ElaB/YqjD/DUF883 family membrane-anchored ribosome-binding protein
MNTTRDVLAGSDLRMPSGCEVETATFIAEPVSAGSSMPESHDSGMRGKLDDLKSRGLSSLRNMQRTMGERTSVVKSDLDQRTSVMKSNLRQRTSVMKNNLHQSLANVKTSTRTGVNDQVTKMQTSMASSPMKWAGIAAGSGFAIGLIGRFVHWRNKHHRHHAPQLVIIESAC